MTDTQLELSLGASRVTQSLRINRSSPPFTARWWFNQMRRVVDSAAPPARPEQVYLTQAGRRN